MNDYPIINRTVVLVGLMGAGKSTVGRRLAERLRLVEISAIYSSDLKRSALSARHIARYHDVRLYSLQELREMYFGDW
ncbi:MAG: histidine phosphatase family protein, partial [Alphaproteobacteria bacterium]